MQIGRSMVRIFYGFLHVQCIWYNFIARLTAKAEYEVIHRVRIDRNYSANPLKCSVLYCCCDDI